MPPTPEDKITVTMLTRSALNPSLEPGESYELPASKAWPLLSARHAEVRKPEPETAEAQPRAETAEATPASRRRG